jgi:hypothetical protein
MLFAVNAKTKNIIEQKLNNLAQTSNYENVKTLK